MKRNLLILLLFVLFVLMLGSVFVGRYQQNPLQDALYGNKIILRLIYMLRIPRILTAVIVGSGLAVSGLVMQTIFRNPLAEGGILGVSQGAGFGAALGILLTNNNPFFVQMGAFICGFFAMLMVFFISKKSKGESVLALLLAGIAVSALFSAGTGILKYFADSADQLPAIVYWFLGSLASSNWNILLRVVILYIPIILYLWFYRWRLNLHTLDPKTAFSLGLKLNWEILSTIAITVLLTSTIVSISGIIGWVGLIIPNYARKLSGADTSNTLPIVFLLGAIYTLICDNLSRALLPGEIPLGIFTALIGAILFILLLTKTPRYNGI